MCLHLYWLTETLTFPPGFQGHKSTVAKIVTAGDAFACSLRRQISERSFTTSSSATIPLKKAEVCIIQRSFPVSICEGEVRRHFEYIFLKVNNIKGGKKFRIVEEFEVLFCSERSRSDSRR